MKLGRLEKLDLRTYWRKEDTEFTPWLAREENIQLLSETIGIELEVKSQEKNVGPFRADILCTDTTDDHFVLIENQLERTDHSHLGQLMTYAAGLDVVTVIWIAQRFTEEHRAALDWLNRITDNSINFFGIEIELYRIDDSIAAPMFNIVSKPNDWAKSVRKSAASQNITDTKLKQQIYWEALKTFMEDNKSFVRLHSAQPQHWVNAAIGRSNFYLTASVNSRENTISIWLNIVGEDAHTNYDKLYELAYESSLTQVSPDLLWDKLEGKKSSTIILKTEGDFTKEMDWPNQHAWFKENLEKFSKFFKPLVKKV